MYEKRELYRAIGEMAYVIAKAHKGLQAKEKIAFFEIIEKELHFEAWAAESRFELLDEVTHPTLEHAYNEAINEFRKYKDHLDEPLKKVALRVLKAVAEAYHGTSEMQEFVLGRFVDDLKKL